MHTVLSAQALKWKMWIVCNTVLKKHIVQRKNLDHTNTRRSSEPLKARSLTNNQGPCCSRHGCKTDIISQHWWRTRWLAHANLGLFNLIVWRVLVARQHNSLALVNNRNEQFTYVWPLANAHHSINHISAIAAAVSAQFSCSHFLTPSLHHHSIISISLSCFVSCFPLCSFFCSLSVHPLPPTLPITFSVLCIISQ